MTCQFCQRWMVQETESPPIYLCHHCERAYIYEGGHLKPSPEIQKVMYTEWFDHATASEIRTFLKKHRPASEV